MRAVHAEHRLNPTETVFFDGLLVSPFSERYSRN
jgi:hypothetical protein